MPLNYDLHGVINKQLYKLKKCSQLENTRSKKNTQKLAKYVAKIHMHNVSQEKFKIYNARWIIEQVYKIQNSQYKNDIISALKFMAQVEIYNTRPKKNKFLTWDIIQSDWQKNYQSGRVGSCVWDIACIINVANDSILSEIFLTNYLRHGGEKPTLAALYANLYYVKVFEAIKNKDFENIIDVTRKILEDGTFDMNIISYNTLITLNITGY